MKTKQIVFTKPYTAELLEVDLPELQPDEILVETAFSAISCGTEKANISNNPNVGLENREYPFPRYGGYSSSGIVLKTGTDVLDIIPGDRVTMCWSHHKKHNIISRKDVVKIQDDDISLSDAAFCNIITFPMAAIRKTKVELGESMLIMGLGILGLFAVQLAYLSGATPVIAVDPIAERREKALKFGADYAFDPYDADFIQKVKAVTNGGANTAIEVTGLGIGLEQCLDCMAKFGRVALLGCTRDKNFSIDYYRKVHGPGISLIGAHTLARPQYNSSPGYFTQEDDVKTYLNLLSLKRFNMNEMVEAVYSPVDCSEIYNQLINNSNFPNVVLFDWSLID